MPRPERPLDREAGPIQAFAAELRVLRAAAGDPKYIQMQRLSGRSRTALSEAAGGDHFPTWETVEAFVKVCGGDIDEWRAKWEGAKKAAEANSADVVSKFREQRSPTHMEFGEHVTRRVPQPHSHLPNQTTIDVLLQMWKEQRTQARQCENQRAAMTLFVILGVAGGMTFVAVTASARLLVVAVALTVSALGTLGALASAKYYERFKMHMDAAQALRHRIDELQPGLSIENDWSENRSQHQASYGVLYRIRLRYLWIALHAGIALLGVTVAVVTVFG
ncbi:helix-turn-helix domain-containing protein [Nocardia mangyaensis]|uniref:helix-turn-helix domain-containing protein n=1 Tax=Nocardia mangyaensis TaxID=2213200 RepID=UPI00267712BF|nr:helix-turn-helix transcriptional regulator [Nocardia mangyaensis]MDO3645673.1 helix-turn-helix transcriptional regulator [Nocardia mangyaensis]